MIPLKCLSNFWKTLEMALINCETNLILTWSANCVITNAAVNRGTTFVISDTKLYVAVVTLLTQDNVKLLQQLKSGFKRTIYCNRYHSKREPLNPPNPCLDYLIDPIYQGLNILVVFPFNTLDDRTGNSRYYVPTVKVEGYNVMVDGKNVFDPPIKNKLKT